MYLPGISIKSVSFDIQENYRFNEAVIEQQS